MALTRRWFIGGAASLGAFQGCRFVADPLFGRGGAPRLTFGVVTDIHFIAANTDCIRKGNGRTFIHALKWFDAQGVDAIVIPGDMADSGLYSELKCVADAWNEVFPGNRSRTDGRIVEKVFVYGNHDWEGFHYGYDIFGRKSQELVHDHLPRIGMKKSWESIFEEEYAPVYRKTVKGFDFVGAHWDGDAGAGWKEGMPAMKDFFARNAKSFDPSLPLFYVQHPHPRGTCYGPLAWGRDSGVSTRTLSAFPNAVAFSGHSHYSLVDERSVWQGDFTSIGCGSLRYEAVFSSEFDADVGYENHTGSTKARPAGEKTMAPVVYGNQRSGLLVNVYDDRMTLTRRDFLRDADIGPDWVMPLPAAESRPFAFAERARKTRVPSFPAGAALKVDKTKTLLRKDTGLSAEKRSSAEVPAFALSFPGAVQSHDARVLRYDVTVETRDGSVVLTRRIVSPAFSVSVEHAEKSVEIPIAFKDLPPKGEFRFVVRAVESFGRSGAPLCSRFFTVA